MRIKEKEIQLKEHTSKLLQSTAKSAVTLPKSALSAFMCYTLPKHRHIRKLHSSLGPLEKASQEMQHAREQLFKRIALKIKNRTHREDFAMLLNGCIEPAGPEQMFLAAIYPLALKRNLIVYTEPTEPHRLDVEVGYIGHADVYYFWILQLNGEESGDVGKIPEPQREEHAGKIIHIYQIPAAGFIDMEDWDVDEFIIKTQLFFINILEDLKRRGYLIAPAKSHIPDTVYWQRKSKHGSRADAYKSRYSLNTQRRRKTYRGV